MNVKQTLTAIVKHDIFVPALIGVALRIALMPFFIIPYDIVSQQFSLTGIMNHYDPYSLSVSMYPPFVYMFLQPFLLATTRAGLAFSFYIVPATFKAGSVTGLVTSIYTDPGFLVFWKSPLLIFDLLTGLLIYGLTKEFTNSNSKAKLGFVLWFFNPLVLITSYVHGAFDVIAAFFILLGIYFLSKNKYLLSGISFGFGGMTKISPFLIAVPLAALIFFERPSESSKILSRKRFFKTATFLVGCIIPLLTSILWNLNYYHLIVASTLNELSINGGLNQWFFAADWHLRVITVIPIMNILKEIFYFYPLISLIPLILFRKTFWNSKVNSYVILLFSAVSLVIVYLVSPATLQPQYFLWLVPILTVVSMRNENSFWALVILSLSASAFLFSIESPFVFMYPLALFTPLLNVNTLNSIIVNYATMPGLFGSLLWETLLSLFGAIGFFGLLLTMVLIAKEFRRMSKDAAK